MFEIKSKQQIIRGLIIGLGAVLVLLAIVIAGSKVAGQDKLIVKPYQIDYTIGKSGETVFDALRIFSENKKVELKYSNNSKYGVFVESINGVKNGDDGKYWQYYVNGKLGEVAADKKELKAGDKVEWRFEKVPEM